MTSIKVEGIETVQRELNREIGRIQGRTIGGLLGAGLILQGEAQRRVPVETGNLRASAYTRKGKDDPNTVEVGFEAVYALFVHENLEAKLKGEPRPSGLGVYWGPKGEPRFLAKALEAKRSEMLNHIIRKAKR